jgi:hypothetical protein
LSQIILYVSWQQITEISSHEEIPKKERLLPSSKADHVLLTTTYMRNFLIQQIKIDSRQEKHSSEAVSSLHGLKGPLDSQIMTGMR